MRDDRGMVAGMEAVALGMLVFVFGTLLIVNTWAVVDGKLAVEAAAREATRAFVESPSADAGWAAAEAAAGATIAGHGRDPARLSMRAAEGAELRRCAPVTFETRYDVPVLPMRLLGRAGGTITVTGRHTERVDAHRSGLPGEASC